MKFIVFVFSILFTIIIIQVDLCDSIFIMRCLDKILVFEYFVFLVLDILVCDDFL